MNKKALILLSIISNVSLCINYQTQIQPIFSQYCTGCHPNSGGLSLTSYDNVMEGGNSGMVIAVYNHTGSNLWQRINSGNMPPEGNDLSPTQVGLIAQWINEGALPYEVDYSDMDYDEDIYPIFEESCSSGYCHGGDAGGLTLLTYDELMDGGSHGAVVIPGDGPGSNLIQKLSAAPPFGNQMPNNMPPLHPLTIAKINTWINEGANPSGPEIIELVINHNENWNMVGLPLIMEDTSQMGVYPESIENTLYEFMGAYIWVQELENGVGYWLRFAESGVTVINGIPIYELTLNLNEGWNMISGLSFSVDIETGISDPNDILIVGTIYEFFNGYANATQLEPGRGYMIRTHSAGQIYLSAEERSGNISYEDGINKLNSGTQKLPTTNKISINGFSLYFGDNLSSEEMIKYSLPPKPPLGAFDVRFEGNMKLSEQGGQIEVQSPTEFLTIECQINNGEQWTLINSRTGETFTLENGLSIVIPSADELQLVKNTEILIPANFSLHQNFPNPFNPKTVIKFDLSNNGHITLSVFNAQGQYIKNLMDGIFTAGTYSTLWDGEDTYGFPVPSGLYFYKLETVENSITKKMILLR
ncbi:MAG: c-type cytochrome domain-containing protein [Candidatus Marinimicrobia bacterium]|nr:c-type cytochrome domain-containing protein [Candidatus Neomarinimicrobiota bacterium]